MLRPDVDGQGIRRLGRSAHRAPSRQVWRSSAEGVSAPRFLLVAAEPQLAEVEPNDDRLAPQILESLPAVLNGRLEKSGDVDCFAMTWNCEAAY